MLRFLRPRWLSGAALTVALAASGLVVAACSPLPNSVFHPRTEFNREVGFLFQILIWLGTLVFVVVEAILIYTLVRYRRRGAPHLPEHVHGNTILEVTWTIIPAVILVFIAIPTVRTIFRTQAKARADALQVEVIGHQWWWEFRYPQYTARNPAGKLDTVVTANELYLPIGRTVTFTLKSQDVIHSFWIPGLGGKRDLITNHTNYLWFTPDSTGVASFDGFCAEYCGTSHANMRFRAFTVTAEQFQSWIAHQLTPAAYALPAPAAPAAAGQVAANVGGAVAQNPQLAQPTAPPGAQVNPQRNVGGNPPAGSATGTNAPTVPSAGRPGVGVPTATVAPPPAVAQGNFIAFPREQMAHTVPSTPVPSGLTFDTTLQGDPGRGGDILRRGQGACLGCHTIRGNPSMVGQIGPNLTHVGSRNTIAAGLYPNDRRHLALWIKNARKMKPGILMPTLGLNQYDPVLGAPMKTGGLTDQQIADIVAYLQALR
jgi:cytochrome c oxidase subunit 2